jgi:hypothetical protein
MLLPNGPGTIVERLAHRGRHAEAAEEWRERTSMCSSRLRARDIARRVRS